jgi:hypothetical protein
MFSPVTEKAYLSTTGHLISKSKLLMPPLLFGRSDPLKTRYVIQRFVAGLVVGGW